MEKEKPLSKKEGMKIIGRGMVFNRALLSGMFEKDTPRNKRLIRLMGKFLKD